MDTSSNHSSDEVGNRIPIPPNPTYSSQSSMNCAIVDNVPGASDASHMEGRYRDDGIGGVQQDNSSNESHHRSWAEMVSELLKPCLCRFSLTEGTERTSVLDGATEERGEEMSVLAETAVETRQRVAIRKIRICRQEKSMLR
jgi:hypothetical protein